MSNIRSPFFYVGDKYKLMPQLLKYFPKNIGTYVEPFLGGGSSFLYVNADEYILNDVNPWIIKLHKKLLEYSNNNDELLNELFKIIKRYKFSCSYLNINVPDELKLKFKKTYYSKYNKDSYNKLKNNFNLNQNDILKLYILLIYGFNHMIRFNNDGLFNLPVGNVDFNKNTVDAINNYLNICSNRKIKLSCLDYKMFLKNIKFKKDTFIYLDPPYLISSSEYNKLWNENDEIELYECLDKLNEKGIYFGITNLVKHKGKNNDILLKWCKKYNVYNIKSNYISYNDNTIKNESKEIYVTNYGKSKI